VRLIDKLDEACTNADDDACATPQRRSRHELAWIMTDFLSDEHRATGLVETALGGRQRQPARCSHKTQDKFAIAFMAKKLLHRCICAQARAHMHFLRRVCMHLDWCFGHHACKYTLDGCCEHQCTHLLTRSLQNVHMCLCTCSLFVQRWGNEDGGVRLVYASTCCLAWGVILTEGKIGVLSVPSLFLTRVGVYVGVCVCIRTHTHALHRWGTRM